jgi:hypothetical protein
MDSSITVLSRRCARAALLALLVCASPTFAATQQELEATLQALADEVASLKAQLAKVSAEQQQQITSTAPRGNLTPDAANGVAEGNTASSADRGVSFFGYGQVDYARPKDNPSDTTESASRFVIGMNNRFDEKTRMISELEVENAVSSADDPGEVEVEQMYVERSFNDQLFGKVGLFLIPSGLLNESHEPANFYGVFRNRVETAIIPTTWREGGFLVQGNTDFGLRWDAGLTTGFDLSKWDPASPEGAESPLGSIHQELALAKASDLAGVLALNYTGIAGVRLGASIFTGDASQGQPGFSDNRITLWEAHGTWTPGRFEFAALYAIGHISNTAKINATFVGNPTLIPESFYGWYTQAAYDLYDWQSASIRPFVRFERLNTASNFADLSPGLTPSEGPDQDIITGGFSFLFAHGVVLKADYQHFHGDGESDLINFGLGYQF